MQKSYKKKEKKISLGLKAIFEAVDNYKNDTELKLILIDILNWLTSIQVELEWLSDKVKLLEEDL